MPEAVPKGRGRPKGMKNGEGKPVKPERPATHHEDSWKIEQ